MTQIITLVPADPRITGKLRSDTASALVCCDASAAPFTVTLPDVADSQVREIKIVKTDSTTNAVTIATANNQKIDGASNDWLDVQYDARIYTTDRTGWYQAARGNKHRVAVSSNPVGWIRFAVGTAEVANVGRWIVQWAGATSGRGGAATLEVVSTNGRAPQLSVSTYDVEDE